LTPHWGQGMMAKLGSVMVYLNKSEVKRVHKLFQKNVYISTDRHQPENPFHHQIGLGILDHFGIGHFILFCFRRIYNRLDSWCGFIRNQTVSKKERAKFHSQTPSRISNPDQFAAYQE
jgi:hypothetical protein